MSIEFANISTKTLNICGKSRNKSKLWKKAKILVTTSKVIPSQNNQKERIEKFAFSF